MVLDPSAIYLEHRYDRVQKLQIIVRELGRQLYDHSHPLSEIELTRVKLRLARAHRHLTELTGGVA